MRQRTNRDDTGDRQCRRVVKVDQHAIEGGRPRESATRIPGNCMSMPNSAEPSTREGVSRRVGRVPSSRNCAGSLSRGDVGTGSRRAVSSNSTETRLTPRLRRINDAAVTNPQAGGIHLPFMRGSIHQQFTRRGAQRAERQVTRAYAARIAGGLIAALVAEFVGCR
jgi:hypothetical protein